MATTPEHAMRLLGLNDQASIDDVRIARRMMAMKYHPDRSFDVETSTRQMARINAAADILTQHINQQSTFKLKWNSLNADLLAMQRKLQRKASQAYRPERRRTPCERQGHSEKECSHKTTLPNVYQHPTQHLKSLKGLDPAERANLTHIRFAAASYRRVLEQIGTAAPIPTVDTKALSFSKRA